MKKLGFVALAILPLIALGFHFLSVKHAYIATNNCTSNLHLSFPPLSHEHHRYRLILGQNNQYKDDVARAKQEHPGTQKSQPGVECEDAYYSLYLL